MSEHPCISPQQLVDRLKADNIVTDLDIVSLLGSARHNVTLNRLEMSLVRHHVLSAERLAQYKEEVSGVRVYRPGEVIVTPDIPLDVVRTRGVLATAAEPPLVLMVEDTPENLEAVRRLAPDVTFAVGLVTAPTFAELFAETYKDAEADRTPYAVDLFEVLDASIAARATDLHLSAGVPPRARVDGKLINLPFKPLDRAWLSDQIDKLVAERHRRDLDNKMSTDLGYLFGNVRFRVNIAHDDNGPTMALRQLASKIPTPKEIGLPDRIRDFANLERGLVLVTGPTGSGKSTTLAAVLHEIVMGSSRHVITLEDPIEFRLPIDGPSHVNQRELGSSFASFGDGLRDALRQDPEVVLVGELRDADTIKTALVAAETGHLVLSTLHTYDAPSTILRLVNSFPANEQDSVRVQLSQQLRGVVSQTLLPKASGKGRVAAFELLLNNTAVASNLRKVDGLGALRQTMQTSKSTGMQTMEMALAQLAYSGVVAEAEARFRARNQDEYDQAVDWLKRGSTAG